MFINKKKQFYCYSEEEKRFAIEECGKKAQITRFKGLGEISPSEFKDFIGEDIRLDPVLIDSNLPNQPKRTYFRKLTLSRKDIEPYKND